MAFIPNSPQIGDKVRLIRDVSVLAGTFTEGHVFTITGTNSRGYDLVDDDGRKLVETSSINFTKHY